MVSRSCSLRAVGFFVVSRGEKCWPREADGVEDGRMIAEVGFHQFASNITFNSWLTGGCLFGSTGGLHHEPDYDCLARWSGVGLESPKLWWG